MWSAFGGIDRHHDPLRQPLECEQHGSALLVEDLRLAVLFGRWLIGPAQRIPEDGVECTVWPQEVRAARRRARQRRWLIVGHPRPPSPGSSPDASGSSP